MSDIDKNAQNAEAPVLTTGERLLVGINFWAIVGIVGFEIIKNGNYWAAESWEIAVVGWLLLCGLFFGSPALWRFVAHRRVRAGVALGLFVLFHAFYWLPGDIWIDTMFPGANEEIIICNLRIK